jgi:hypothetical protein
VSRRTPAERIRSSVRFSSSCRYTPISLRRASVSERKIENGSNGKKPVTLAKSTSSCSQSPPTIVRLR